MGQLIHFFGPDGAGKSTQVKLLVDYYQHKGLKVRKYWVRSPHTFAYFLWKFFISIGFYRSIVNVFDVQIKLPAVQNSIVLSKFWSFIDFVSVLPLVIRAQVLLRRGYTLVAERYLIDTITTIAYFLGDPTFSTSILSRVLLLLIPRQTNFVFLDSDFGTIYQRRAKFYEQTHIPARNGFFNYGALPAAAVEPSHFIDFQRKLYSAFAIYCDALIVDTTRNSPDETFSQIVAYLDGA